MRLQSLFCWLLAASLALARAAEGDVDKLVYYPVSEAKQAAAEEFIRNLGSPGSAARIAYGDLATTDQFPAIASLQLFAGSTRSHLCGASLIAPNLLLTAAHCMFTAEGIVDIPGAALVGGTTLAGSGNFKETFSVTGAWVPSTYNHAQWSNSVPYGDLCVVKLAGTSSIKPVELATEDPAVGAILATAGWGYDETVKKTAALTYLNLTVSAGAAPCDWRYPGVLCSTAPEVAPGRYPSICQGDSGGPVFLQGTNVQVGVASFVKNDAGGCGKNTFTGVTSVASFKRVFVDAIVAEQGIKLPPSGKDGGLNTTTGDGPSAPSPAPAPVPPPAPESASFTSPTTPSVKPSTLCTSFRATSLNNQRFSYGKALRPAFRVTSYSVCAQHCLSTPLCKTFNFRKRDRKCMLFVTPKEGKKKADTAFKSGYIYCAKFGGTRR